MRSVKVGDLKNRLSNVLRKADAFQVAAVLVRCRDHPRGLHNWTGVAGILLTMAAVGMLALTPAGSAQAETLEFFRLPSGNIGCLYFHDSSPSLRCDIRTGLKPKPSQPASCDVEWGDSVTLSATGRTELFCHGDTVFDPRAKVLRYGAAWARGPFTCTSRTTGLTCENTAGHGFFLSRQLWRRF